MHSPKGGIVIGPGIIGTEINEAAFGEIQDAPSHGDFAVGGAHIDNGVGQFEMFSYLSEDAQYRGGYLYRWGDMPPTIYVAAGTTAEQIAETRATAALINSALPQRWQLRFNAIPKPAAYNPQNGEIVVEFSPKESWPATGSSDTRVGLAITAFNDAGEIEQATVFVDPVHNDTQRDRMYVLAHEFLHALGRGHADARNFPHTVTHATLDDKNHVRGYILHQLDNEALLAVYSRMEPGTPAHLVANDLGPWESESFNVLATTPVYGGNHLDIESYREGFIMFGASERNGVVRPFAFGVPFPDTTLANSTLTGDATWTGRLLGLTIQSEPLAGAAGMTIDIATLQGDLSFTGMEKWGANQLPRAIGTGTRWGDGDLRYGIQVRANGFHKLSGDTGRVEGVFVGRDHEGMMGIVDRHDMSAGFGGTR